MAARAETRPVVLVVDDEEAIRRLLSTMLQAEGYSAIAVSTLAQAQDQAEKTPPDVAIIDAYLNGESGIDLALWLHKRDPDCPLIIISGDPSGKAAVATVRAGAFDYLAKPIESHILLEQVGKAWDLRRARLGRSALEAENRAIRERLRAMFDAVGEALICIDASHTVLEVNRFARDLFLIGDAVPAGAPLTALWPTVPETVRKALDVAVGARRPVPEFLLTPAAPPLLGKALIAHVEPLTLPDSDRSGALLCLRDVTRIKHLESVLRERYHYHGFIGRSSVMQELYDNLKLVADTDSTVLLVGESGTGKELAAAALHYESHRADKPFLKINCAALPESLLESELFGHARGAFTGAVASRKGVFESANGGTLFLDEIGDVSPRLQLSLLRVIETKTFERVGEVYPRRVDVRLIAATNADLRERVEKGLFREDLYYRLHVVCIELPPLRRRQGDIPLLADFFVARLAERLNRPVPRLAPETYEILCAHPWPGNVRQLDNALEQAVVLCREEILMPHHLSREILDAVVSPPIALAVETIRREFRSHSAAAPAPAFSERAKPGREAVERALESCGWNQSVAARLLGVNRTTVWRMMKRWDLRPGKAGG